MKFFQRNVLIGLSMLCGYPILRFGLYTETQFWVFHFPACLDNTIHKQFKHIEVICWLPSNGPSNKTLRVSSILRNPLNKILKDEDLKSLHSKVIINH